MALINVEGLTLSYESMTVIKGLSFTVNAGDYLCVIGENGSGKSTLMKALLGHKNILKGKIEFGDGLQKSEIGYLPQQTEVQKDFPASVREIVLSGCLNSSGFHPFYTKAQRELAAANMERLGITGLAGRCYRELSGGQQQRVLLARALCAAKELLVLDEPVAGLDPVVTQSLYKLIKEVNDGGMTVVMVSHDLGAALTYASHILHISHTPLFFGTKDEYISSNIGRRFTSAGGDAQ